MSVFGENTAQQKMLESIVSIGKDLFGLSDDDIVIVLQSVLSYLIDPYENRLKEIRAQQQEANRTRKT